jgi:Xaa-Pro aminopeptidase
MVAKSSNEALVLAGAPDEQVDLLYATGFMAPDPIVYVKSGRWQAMVVSSLEYGRAVSTSRHRGIQIMTPQDAGLKGHESSELSCWILALLKSKNIKRVRVPFAFPSGLLRKLEQARIQVRVVETEPFPDRRTKSKAELRLMRESQQAAVIAMRSAVGILEESKIDTEGFIRYGKTIVTSEMLQQRIAEVLLRHQCYCSQTIVACGVQGADPHERGHGPVMANQLVVIDIFPRHQGHGYCGDITRTVVKGKASRKLKHMYYTVKRAHAAALRIVKPGIATKTVHQVAVDSIAQRGYQTGRDAKGFYGFMHSTGHGIGLAVHEGPSVGSAGRTRLRVGDVITIEPGLYYPETGGIRIEDTVVVTPTGYQYLAPCEKVFEIE